MLSWWYSTTSRRNRFSRAYAVFSCASRAFSASSVSSCCRIYTYERAAAGMAYDITAVIFAIGCRGQAGRSIGHGHDTTYQVLVGVVVAVPEQPVLFLQLRAPLLGEGQVGLQCLELPLQQLQLGRHGVRYLRGTCRCGSSSSISISSRKHLALLTSIARGKKVKLAATAAAS
jgi:hypothetical protein